MDLVWSCRFSDNSLLQEARSHHFYFKHLTGLIILILIEFRITTKYHYSPKSKSDFLRNFNMISIKHFWYFDILFETEELIPRIHRILLLGLRLWILAIFLYAAYVISCILIQNSKLIRIIGSCHLSMMALVGLAAGPESISGSSGRRIHASRRQATRWYLSSSRTDSTKLIGGIILRPKEGNSINASQVWR